jgi:TAK1-binding protein 1
LLGCCRALLCKTDADGVLRVHQLSVDHDLNNTEELQRLTDLGLDVEKIRVSGQIGNQPYTRTLGDYNIKINYKDIEMLRYICIIVGSFAGKMCQITAEQKMFFM